MLPLQQGVEVQSQRELDGLARRPGRSNDDYPAVPVRRPAVRVRINRKVVVAGGVHGQETTG